jgi:hypothetical protein
VLLSLLRRRRAKAIPVAVPHHSSRQARKVSQWTLSVITTQNILMKKLGSMDFDKYLKLFEEGLSTEQVRMIMELFSDRAPILVPVEEVV